MYAVFTYANEIYIEFQLKTIQYNPNAMVMQRNVLYVGPDAWWAKCDPVGDVCPRVWSWPPGVKLAPRGEESMFAPLFC
jgi:hypothetical protein